MKRTFFLGDSIQLRRRATDREVAPVRNRRLTSRTSHRGEAASSRFRPGAAILTAMTTFFVALALVHFIGLYVMLFALRRVPVGLETENGFMALQEDEVAEVVRHAPGLPSLARAH
jgi:hypothetical protein